MDSQYEEAARWGAKLNTSEQSRTPADYPTWAKARQHFAWQSRGFILWEEDSHHIARLRPEQALDVLARLQADNTWRQDGLIVGQPIAWSARDDEQTKKNAPIEQEITFSGAEAEQLFDLLQKNEPALRTMAKADEEQRRHALAKVYAIILEAAERHRAREQQEAQAKEESAVMSISDWAVI